MELKHRQKSSLMPVAEALESIPDEVLKRIVFSVPWQYSSDTGSTKDPDGFDPNAPVEKKFNELKRDELQKQCFSKFHTNPQINSAIRDMMGRMTGEGFGTSSGIQEIQDQIDSTELDWRNRLYYFWPKWIARCQIEGELHLCLTLHPDGFVETDYIDPTTICGADDGSGIIWHPSKSLLPLFYSIKLADKVNNILVPSVFVAYSPSSLVDVARTNPYYDEALTRDSKVGGLKYKDIGGFNRFIVSYDKGFMTRRAISHLVTTIEWLNYYESLKKYEIDHKKASGSYAWVFYFEDLAAFRTWMSLSDDDKRKTGVGSKMTPGARLLLPPGMKVEIKNPTLTPIREQDTDIMSMAISGLNIPEDVATGQAKGTFASVKASRGPMSDRVADENAYFGRWLKYDFWKAVFFLKQKMGVMDSLYKVKQAVGFKNREPVIKNVSKPPEQLIDVSHPSSEISDFESRTKALLGVKHGPLSESLGIPNSMIARKIGVEGYARARLDKATEDEMYPELLYEMGVDAEQTQEKMEGEPKKSKTNPDLKDRRQK